MSYMPVFSKKIIDRTLNKKRNKSKISEDLSPDNLFTFMGLLINSDDERREFLSPVRRPDGRYVTSEDNLDNFIDPRIFRETQVKRFLRWLTTTPPLLNLLFTWLFIEKAGMKLDYFTQQEEKHPEKIFKQGEAHRIRDTPRSTGENTNTFTIHNLGHATQLIQTSGMNIITDPVFGDLAPVFYPAMTSHLKQDVTPEELPAIDVILISHNHRDHVDLPSLKKILTKNGKNQPELLVPAGDEEFFRSLGFTKIRAFEWHEQITLTSASNKKVTFCSVPADHRSGRSGHDSHQSLVTGWTISPKDRKEILYFAGDTARINNVRMKSLALDIYQLYQHKTEGVFNLKELPLLINMVPGGPNYTRKDMRPTHQSAVDSVLSAFRLSLALTDISAKHQRMNHEISAEQWLNATATVFMHQNKYELGPDRFNENYFIFTRLCSYLSMDEKTLALHEQKQQGKNNSWSLFHRRKDFIIEGAKELEQLAKEIWPEQTAANQQTKIIEFLQARTHFPLIREKLSSQDVIQFEAGTLSTIAPDTHVNGKLKGSKNITTVTQEKADTDSPSPQTF